MRTIVLNSSNIVPGSNNTELEYLFPGGGVEFVQGDRVTLSNLSMYYSTPNITSANNNNSFQYDWIDGTTHTVAIEDGFYEIANLNDYLHQQQINNKHYLIETATGNFVYFLSLSVNTVTYKIDVTSFPMSQTLYPGAQYTVPAGATWTIPVAFEHPVLTVLSNQFRFVIGFLAGQFPAPATMTQAIPYVASSTLTPQVSPLSTFTLKCSLVNNSYSIPNSLLYSFPPFGSFGSQFQVSPSEFSFIDIIRGQYTSFRMSLTDQNDRPITILDPDLTILLVVKNANE